MIKLCCKKIILLVIICSLAAAVHGCSPGLRDTDKIRPGMKLLAEGRKTQALKSFDAAIDESNNDSELCIAIGELLFAEGYKSESIPYIKRAINSPMGKTDGAEYRLRNAVLYTTLGDVYYGLRDVKDAENAYRQAICLNKDSAGTYNNWGYMYADLGLKLDDALRLTSRAVELEPGNGMYMDSLGWAYFKLRDHRKVVDILAAAVKLMPSSTDIRYHLGMAYESVGNKKSASVEYTKALAIAPSNAYARARLSALR